MKIGKYTLHEIEAGYIGLDGGAMFGVVPKPLWEKSNPCDESNRVTLDTRCLLLKGDNRNILIDTGIGDNWDEKFKQIYRVDYTNTLAASLQKAGVAYEQITDVILTHLHFDHTGGSTRLEEGKWVPTFPNALYYVQKKQFDWAVNPSERDRASYIQPRFMPLVENGMLTLIDGNNQFEDGIDFIVINGHTFGQQMVKISDSASTLLYCGDLMPFSSHIPAPYIMGYDLQPVVTLNEKKEILPRAAAEEWKLYFEHDPYFAMATVGKNEKGFFAKEKFGKLV
jgi:glyoxylase-like metal-dependent hydrolase (beta-lactamase superfamily II)